MSAAPTPKLTTAQALATIARLTFRPFTEQDWESFMGCQTDNPLMAEDGDVTYVVDANTLTVWVDGDECGGNLYTFTSS